MQTLNEWLSYLENLHPKNIDMGLERVRAVAQKMDLLVPAPLVITVGGTNGKGSTVTFCTEILKADGKTVGTYISPHLHVYNERVSINGMPVSDHLLMQSFAAVDAARGETSLTYFEFGTLSALWIFKQRKVDAVVLEVGLGGRLDAVNIVEPDVAVVTSIGLDHIDWLGSDINGIAREKAGIFRVGKPAVCGQINPPPAIAETAKNLGAMLAVKNQDFTFSRSADDWGFTSGISQQALAHLPLSNLPIENAATAIQAVLMLPQPPSEAAIRAGIKQARLAGRLELYTDPMPMMLDVGHNPQAAEYLREYLLRNPVRGKNYALLAMLADKDAAEVTRVMHDCIAEWHLAGLDVPRGRTARQLQMDTGVEAICYNQVGHALDALLEVIGANDRVIVFGSFYTVSAAQQWIKEHKRG